MPTSPTNRANAVWIGCHDAEGGAEWHHRTRATAEAQLVTLIDTVRAQGLRLLIGFDFAMGYPAGFAARLTGKAQARAVWAWLDSAITDGPDNRNNRFEIAARINAGFPEGPGPFWSHPTGQLHPGLPYRRAGIDYAALGLAEACCRRPLQLFQDGRECLSPLGERPVVLTKIEAVLAPPDNAAGVALEQEVPEPPLGGLRVLLPNCREHGLAGHEAPKDLPCIADVVGLHPVERRGQPR